MNVTTSHGRVSFDQVGEGPDLILLHSLLSDSHIFDRVVPDLRQNHRVTMVDLPGYGDTDLVDPGIENYANQVGALLEALQTDPATTAILGNGLGGFVALATAVFHGSAFDKLIIAGAGAGFPEGGTEAFGRMIDGVSTAGMDAILDLAVGRIFTQEYLAANPDQGEERRQVLRGADPEAFIRACQTLMTLDLREEVSSVKNPTLIVVGSEDAATPPSMCLDLSERMPDARLRILDGLAHAPQLQDPDAFLAAVDPFLLSERHSMESTTEQGTFDVADFTDELRAAPTNLDVGTKVWFENDRIRVWEILLQPGERGPFHAHTTNYFWTVVEPGRGLQRFTDGTFAVRDYGEGDTKYLEHGPDSVLIHDLENIGDTPLRFVTVELLD